MFSKSRRPTAAKLQRLFAGNVAAVYYRRLGEVFHQQRPNWEVGPGRELVGLPSFYVATTPLHRTLFLTRHRGGRDDLQTQGYRVKVIVFITNVWHISVKSSQVAFNKNMWQSHEFYKHVRNKIV